MAERGGNERWALTVNSQGLNSSLTPVQPTNLPSLSSVFHLSGRAHLGLIPALLGGGLDMEEGVEAVEAGGWVVEIGLVKSTLQ